MNKELDYASNSDESDEDFRPDQAGESAVSEEESAGSEIDEEHVGEDEAKPKNVRRSKKLTKKTSKKKTAKGKDYESDEDGGNKDVSGTRRSTRQMGESLTNGKVEKHDKNDLESDEEDKRRSNALWADFMKDVGPSTRVSKTVNDEKPSSSSNKKDNDIANKATEKVRNGSEISERPKEETKKTTVTEILDFAGEEIRVQREVDASSIKENKAAATVAPKLQPFGRIMPGAGIKRPVAGSTTAGIGSILNQIGKKKKVSVLEKSQMDWNSFKQDEGIDEQLRTFNKGKDGYLERQDFLQRTDLRQFEIEKNMRQTSRRPL